MQSDIESGAYRMYADYQMVKYYYYAALSFWTRFFDEHQVDIVIHTKEYHGFAYDCCDIVARKRGIKCFHFIRAGYNNTISIYTHNHLIPILDESCVDIKYLLQSQHDKDTVPPSVEYKSFLRRMLYAVGGNLLEDFAMRLVKWNWSPRSIMRKRAKIYWSDKFFGYVKLQCAKKYMESLIKEVDYKKKYVCYFLHFEPEASMQVSTILGCQLVIIKMLSETLPDGWCVYVKEHPVQFDTNNDPAYYHMFDAPLFKTKKFYRKLGSIPNVYLVDYNIKSEYLIKNSQAVASIAGTVLFESVLIGKPVLAFSELNPVAYMRDAFSIHSFHECKAAMDKIKNGFIPYYNDAEEIIRRYVFSGEYMESNIMKLLQSECNDT